MSIKLGTARSLIDHWDAHKPVCLVDDAGATNWNPAAIRSALLEAGEAGDDVAELYQLMTDCKGGQYGCKGADLVSLLREARAKPIEPFWTQDIGFPIEEHVRIWPTGIPRLDHMTRGGCGLTVFGGEPKQGKSFAALGAALSTCEAGWPVVYVNAELTEGQMSKRCRGWFGGDVPQSIARRFLLINTRAGFCVDDALEQIAYHIDWDDDRILIVLDSVNRLVDDGEGAYGTGYFDRLREWGGWARESARLSEGAISFLVVSELNTGGKTKGQQLEYAANLVVRFQAEKNPEHVDINVLYARDSPSGELGVHERVWRESRFKHVGGDDEEGGW